tara:strand:- start:134 stop:508 length:375 start_codon:yes stop_codon:yes gene_type:complete
MTEWTKVCDAVDISKNEIKKFTFDDLDVLITNYGDGFRAFPPDCPHMSEPLDVSGEVNGDILTCCKHVWQWNLRSCEAATGMTEENLLFYDLKEDEGQIFVDISTPLLYSWQEEGDIDEDDFFD